MQRMSKGAQNGFSSAPHAWQHMGHMLMLVGRKYQEAWSFLLLFFSFFDWLQNYDLGQQREGNSMESIRSRADAACA